MKNSIKKVCAASLCAVTVLTSAPCSAVVLAAETATDAPEDYKPFVPSTIREAQQAQEIKKIPEGHAYIPKDTVLNLELETEITSKKAKVGDDVPLVMMDNLIINDVVIIPKGTRVNAKVTKATGSGLFGRAGKLEFMIDSVNALNGVKVPLEHTTEREAGSDDGAVAVVAAVSVIGGLFMKGKNVTFPAGSKFAAKVVADTDLDVPLDRLAEEFAPNKPHGVSITLK